MSTVKSDLLVQDTEYVKPFSTAIIPDGYGAPMNPFNGSLYLTILVSKVKINSDFDLVFTTVLCTYGEFSSSEKLIQALIILTFSLSII